MIKRKNEYVKQALAIGLGIMVAMLGDSAAMSDRAHSWWAHVKALANDKMQGRSTGSPAHKRAAEYVATQFKKAGLEAVGSGGFLQPVSFRTRRIVEEQSSLALIRNGALEPLKLGEDANISMRVDT